jgi:hypothetical protein
VIKYHVCGLNISPVEIYFDISIATNISKTKLSDIEAKLCWKLQESPVRTLKTNKYY